LVKPFFYDEKELLTRIAAGDATAYRTFFDLYKERFYAVVLKMTRSDLVAEEIVQEVFLNIWLKREKLVFIENPSSYFFTAVYRRVYSYYRKLAREEKIKGVLSQSKAFENSTEELIFARESQLLISTAIGKLPSQQQVIFKLSKQEGLSREEIAEQLQLSPNTVKNHLSCAVKTIRALLRNPGFIFLLIIWLTKNNLF
jgi:RNA polymerase sigma-70 factor (family 1)